VQLSSLNVTLQRINTIENHIQSLNSFAQQPNTDFQKILNAKVENNTTPNKVSRAEIDNLISKYADKNGLDEDFVKAVINQESGFNPNATSHCGAMGLMQLMPSTAQGLGVKNAYDAEQNVYYSTLNPWQKHMGFGSEYDELAVYANMRYRTIKVDFEYNGLLWRIQCWKGQYGVLAGGEMGVYTKDPNDVSTTFYECASDEHLLEMSFKFYKTVSDFNRKNLSFERELQEHWWLTGFKFGYCSSNNCVMIMTFKMFDKDMADGFEEGLKNVVDLKGNWCGFVEESNRTSTTTDFYKRSGNTFQVCWVLAGFNNYTTSGQEVPEEDMQQ
jgi:hypothetical protein